MKAFGKYLPLVVLTTTLLTISACEDKSPTGTRAATVFTWEYVMDDPPYFHSIQEVPALAVEEDGTVWIAGYLGTAGNSHRYIARLRPGGQWEAWADEGIPGNFYAYDVAVEPTSGEVFVTLVGNPTLEQSGLYQFIDNPPYLQGFQLVFAHPDPGPVAFNYGTGVMFTRHMNTGNSGLYSFMDGAFHPYTLPNVTGDVLCAAITPDQNLAFAITSDDYLLIWDGNLLNAQQWHVKLNSVSCDWAITLCTDDGFYGGLYADLTKDVTFPGDKAFSSSFGGHEMVLGEKSGVRKIYKYVGGQEVYSEEFLDYPVNKGRIKMNPEMNDEWHQGYIYDGDVLVQRIAH